MKLKNDLFIVNLELMKIIQNYTESNNISIERINNYQTIINKEDNFIMNCLFRMSRSELNGLQKELDNFICVDNNLLNPTTKPFTEAVRCILNILIKNNYKEIMNYEFDK